MAQPDLGSSLVYVIIVLTILFVAGTAWQHFAALTALGAYLTQYRYFLDSLAAVRAHEAASELPGQRLA